MIEIQNERPKNSQPLSSLLAFCKEIIAVCNELSIKPILSGRDGLKVEFDSIKH